MTKTKSLMLAALATLSLGIGTAAMAQESAGGYIAGPSEQQQLLTTSHHSFAAPVANAAPQYGSSDVTTPVSNWPALQGGDGAAG